MRPAATNATTKAGVGPPCAINVLSATSAHLGAAPTFRAGRRIEPAEVPGANRLRASYKQLTATRRRRYRTCREAATRPR
jgi:hypothetical protein